MPLELAERPYHARSPAALQGLLQRPQHLQIRGTLPCLAALTGHSCSGLPAEQVQGIKQQSTLLSYGAQTIIILDVCTCCGKPWPSAHLQHLRCDPMAACACPYEHCLQRHQP